MKIGNNFRQAVEENNVSKIRIMMKDSLLVDPSFKEFDEMDRLASTVNGLYDKHDEKVLKEDSRSWDEDYMNILLAQVTRNFSHERISHLKEVVKKLRPETTLKSPTATERPKTTFKTSESWSYHEQKKRDKKRGPIREVKVAGGAVVIAVVGAAVAATSGSSIILGAAAGAVVGGVVTAVATNGEK